MFTFLYAYPLLIAKIHPCSKRFDKKSCPKNARREKSLRNSHALTYTPCKMGSL